MKILSNSIYKYNEEILKINNGNGITNYKYLHGGIDFTKIENRLARGLAIDSDDNIVTIGFEKFFCLNQLETRDWLSEEFKEEFNRLQPKEKYRCIEKLDGTMVIVSSYKGKLVYSTTSSMNNEYTEIARKYFESLGCYDDLNWYLTVRNSCFVFEYISNSNQIGVYYDTDIDMILLAEVSKDTYRILDIVVDFGFNRPKIEYKTMEELEYIVKHSENIEGYVVENNYGRLIKVKTDWWFRVHLDTTMFFRDRICEKDVVNVVDAILSNKIDDLYSIQNSREHYKEVNKVGRIEDIYNSIIDGANRILSKYKSSKDIAINETKSLERSIAILIINNKEITDKSRMITKEIVRRLRL